MFDFFFTTTDPTEISTLSLHDALPILAFLQLQAGNTAMYAFFLAVVLVFLVLAAQYESWALRSEEHTSELQSRFDLVCRLLLEKKKSGSHGLSILLLLSIYSCLRYCSL